MYLVVIDAHSIWMDVHILPSTTSGATTEKLRGIFATTIVSDSGPNFTSAVFENFLSKNSHTYHQGSNGQAKQAVRAFQRREREDGRRNHARQFVTFSVQIQNNTTHGHMGYTSGATDEEKAEN